MQDHVRYVPSHDSVRNVDEGGLSIVDLYPIDVRPIRAVHVIRHVTALKFK